MEKSKKIQIGLLAVLGLLLIANIFGGGFTSWFGQSEGDKIREAAAMSDAGMAERPEAFSTGNIPGTNANATQLPDVPMTQLKYDEAVYDFGVVNEGTVVKHVYTFTNTGSEPLIISNARGSCGCTVPTWPKQPIPPGGKGEISVEFDTKGKPNRQTKSVTVTANTTPTDTHLEITGEVRSKAQPVSKGGK
ncbi:MAG: DUF1573 domain-containing protein [Saprospiraceae bacterium]